MGSQIHVMFLPYMAPGHMMPMVDIARLFAAQGIRVTIITTTMNAIGFKNSIERDVESGRNISLEILRFPSAEAGLPEGCENLSSAPTPEATIKLIHGIELLEPQIKILFRERRPDCIASDYIFWWTIDVATELGIPRLAFSGSGFFNLCVANSIECYRPHDSIVSETETFMVPGLPDQVEITRSQLPDLVKRRTEFSEFFDKLKEAERKSFGLVWATEDSTLISRSEIENAIRRVMGDENEAKEMRKRARRLAEWAKMAVEEGGSSYNDMKSLIEDIRMFKRLTEKTTKES
uniref:Uncharacterized protein n=1 Tax=Manihot esculenta TaxID=3983 RepID=A0A2C9W671_MANES